MALRSSSDCLAAPRVLPLAALLVVAFAGEGMALDPAKRVTQYTLTVWQTENGLPQDALTAIAQGADGALWLGMPSGLVRFDGAGFRRVAVPEGRGPGDRYVTALLAETDGGLWVTTRDALHHLRDGRWRRFGAEAGLPAGGALGVQPGDDGVLSLATEVGVLRFDPRRGRAEDPRLDGSPPASALAIAQASGGRLLAGTSAGLLVLGESPPRLLTSRDGLASDFVNAVLEDSTGRVWIGTSLGLSVLEGGQVREPAALRALRGVWIRCLLEDRDGNLWIGTRGGGAFRLHGDRLDALSAADGLPDDLVRQILEDRDGALWFVTAGGLARLMDGSVTTWAVREGLAAPFVWSLHEDPGGRLWVGTSGSGVCRLTETGPEVPGFADPGISGVEVRAFLTDREGSLWIGTGGSGLARVRDGRVQWYRWTGNPSRQWISSLLEDGRGRVLAGTGDGVVVVIGDGEGTWYRRADGGRPTTVRSLTEDSDGRIWVGTAAGLACVEDDRLEPVPGAERLDRARVHCILPEGRDIVWVATDAGLGRLAGGRLDLVGAAQGLPNEMLYWLLDDGAGHLWISCDLGILRLEKRQVDELLRGARAAVEPVILGRSDGMRATECNSGHPGGVRRRDGSFCFATTNGVACVDPVRLRSFEVAPRVAIEEVLVDGRPSTPVAAAAPTVRVPRGARRIEIRYAAVSLAAPDKLAFRYRLEGFDPAWVDAGRERSAQFTRLPPGALRFAVTARHGGGAWSEPAAVVTLQVQPALHQTPLFLALGAVALAVLATAGIRLRTAQLRARERRLRIIVEQRTRDLAAANAELERLATADAGTGIANRRRFDSALAEEWRRAARGERPLALLLADIDHFKAFNDRNGHLAGDDCLRRVAAVIGAHARRPGDVAARYGGEEFALLLPETEAAAAAAIAESARAEVAALGMAHEASPTAAVVTISIGWAALIPPVGGEPQALIAAADRALYVAKRRRNTVSGG
jgi:diguanylate cyclase (GGDEF)-like protein